MKLDTSRNTVNSASNVNAECCLKVLNIGGDASWVFWCIEEFNGWGVDVAGLAGFIAVKVARYPGFSDAFWFMMM